MHPDDAGEPLLVEPEGMSRFVLVPDEDPEIYDAAVIAEELQWSTGEVDLSRDLADLAKLTPGQRRFLLTVLAFFAASDGIVIENLCLNFIKEVKVTAARQFYAIQTGIEAIHARMYSLLIDGYAKDAAEKHELFTAIDTMPCVKQKAEWALEFAASDAPFAERLLAFMIVEGLFFSSSFAMIFYFKSLGLLPGLCHSNELINRDEGLHTQFAALLYQLKIKKRVSQERFHAMMRSAVEVEHQFVRDALPEREININADMMCEYVRHQANNLCRLVGYAPLYDPTDPDCPPCSMSLDFMQNIDVENKTNFFERRVSEYKKAKRGGLAVAAKFALTARF